MYGVMGGLGVFGILILLLLAIILPISVYAAQKWAYKCFKELEKLNQKMDRYNPRLQHVMLTFNP
jgi:hypothetical protein